MFEHSTLGRVLASLLVGAAAAPAMGLAVLCFTGTTIPRFEIPDGAPDYTALAVAITGVVALLLGFAIEAAGHLLIDEKVLEGPDIVTCLVQRDKEILEDRLGELDHGHLSGLFWKLAPSHVFAYRDEQWTYYEAYRNFAIVALLYLVFGSHYLCFTEGSILGAAGVIVIAGVAVFVFLRTAYKAQEFYYQVAGRFLVAATDPDKPSAAETQSAPAIG